MSEKKQLWLLTGGNGAGKSTFYRTQLEPRGLPFVNADLLARQLYPEAPELHSYEAAKLAEELRLKLVIEGRSFCFETVFSHPSKIDFAAHAKALGYEIILVFIHLNDVNLNLARIQQRVSEGGHSVPEDKVYDRIPRTLENVKKVLPLCDQVYFLENSRFDKPFERIAEIRHGKLKFNKDELPDWLEVVLADHSNK